MTYGDGPLLIVAGAGTGKTRVLTRRVAYLIGSRRAKPTEILALTFTERAAAEMEERVDMLTPIGQSNVVIRTFHAFGDEVVRQYALELGIGADLQVLSPAEQAIFLGQHLFELPLRHYRPLGDPTRYVRSLISLFSRARDEDVSPADYRAYAEELRRAADRAAGDAGLAEDAEQQHELAATYAAYEELKARHGVLDFADQISLCLRVMRQHPAAAARLRARFRYILVDEFQDTNHAQLELLKLLSADHRNLTVVGDDDQSIFKWRGAAVSNMLAFRRAYPDARIVTLTENFRSHQRILDAAYRLIRHNDPDRLEVQLGISKRIWSHRVEGDPVLFVAYGSASEESDGVAQRIVEGIASGRRAGDYAILVRTNRDADPFLQSLSHRGVPHRFSGTAGLYERAEIRLLLSFLHAIAHPSDGPHLYHVAASSLYGVPAGDMARAHESTERRRVGLRESIEAMAAQDGEGLFSDAAVRAASRLIDDLEHFTALSAERTTGEVLYAFLERTGILRQIAEASSPAAEDEARNMAKFFSIVRSVGNALPVDRVPFFVDQISLLIAAGDDPATAEVELVPDAVNVLTVHKAKGLEFRAVFIGACTHNRFPHAQRGDPLELPAALAKDPQPVGDHHEQEERRLFFVALTRARDELVLTAGRDYGQPRPRRPSPFVLEALGPVAAPVPAAERPAAVLARFAAVEPPAVAARPIPDEEILTLSRQAVEDYLTCPLRYRYAYLLRVPVPTPPDAMYGAALHRAIAAYYVDRLAGRTVTVEEVQATFRAAWIAEGFLSAEHAQAVFDQGLRTIETFVAREEASGRLPDFVERAFSFMVGNDRVTGRWDRVDREDGGAVIIDFKSTEASDQRAADERARGSQQLDIYALAYRRAFGDLPKRVELHFLGSGLVGRATKSEADLARTGQRIAEAGRGIRRREFEPRPSIASCGVCAFRAICPAAAVR